MTESINLLYVTVSTVHVLNCLSNHKNMLIFSTILDFLVTQATFVIKGNASVIVHSIQD